MLYQGDNLYLNWLDDGVAELVFAAGSGVNKLDTRTLASLEQALTILTQQPTLAGLLLRSAHPAFIVGADITEFLALFAAPPQQLRQWLDRAHAIFRRLEDLPVPTLAAINGYALGGGCECALTADFRLATPDARLGLPEVKLGIMPGLGGTVRLPRLLGADNALELIVTGKELNAEAALRIGLIHAVVDEAQLLPAALRMLRHAAAGQLDWRASRAPKLSPLRLNATEAAMTFATASALAADPRYPAPIAAVKTVATAAGLARDAALEVESAQFAALARSDAARAMTGIFLNEQWVKNKARRLAGDAAAPQRAAVLGAGIMGSGIAGLSARQGVPVLMKDIDERALAHGMDAVAQRFSQRLDAQRTAQALAAIHPTLDAAGLARADVVIEAVTEDPRLKARVLAEAEAHAGERAVLASNTSTIPIGQLAQALRRPQNFCGMHFFNPVHRMPLVEIVRGLHTADATIARALAYAGRLGKTAVVVNDGPGFFVNRALFPYIAAFMLLLRDGADFRDVDRAMEQFGWPMGPARLLDAVGLDTASHAQTLMAAGFPQRMERGPRNAIDVLFEQRRLGQKNGAGFYRYPDGQRREDDRRTDALLAPVCRPPRRFDAATLVARLMLPLLNEAARCLEENIVASPAEADIALVYGLGFPPCHGGPCRYFDTLGGPRFLALAQRFAPLGPLYQPPPGLARMASDGERYYPAAAPHAGIRS